MKDLLTLVQFIFKYFLTFITLPAFSLEIPQNLNQSDRSQITQILGHTTSTKLLSHPYPLGGYSGFEVGLSYVQVPISDMSHLGNTTESQSSFSYENLSVSKGLYRNFDISLNFAPPLGGTNISSYGGFLKWGFFQGGFTPVSLSFLVHANTATLEDSFSSTTIGGELLAGLSLNKFSFYLGIGPLKTRSVFLGQFSSSFLTDTGINESELERVNHAFLGFVYTIDKWILALQADRYNQTTLSFKLGLRL